MEDSNPAVKPERTPPQHRSSAPRVRLSCEACRQRKVKCDKLSPCTSCQRLGFVCVPVERARLPRGRTRRSAGVNGSDKELADRVAKLEDMLRRVASERDVPNKTSSSSNDNSTGDAQETKMTDVEAWRDESAQKVPTDKSSKTQAPARARPVASYMGSSFWDDIMQQTQELRNVLDDRLEEEEFDSHNPDGFGNALLGSETPESASNSPQSQRSFTITPEVRRSLCEIYLNKVDPVMKVLHRPTLRAFLIDDQPYLDYPPDHQSPITLSYAVYAMAACTIDNAQSHLLFGVDKKTAITDLQKETEIALMKSDFVTTTDLTILQAFILSLLAARSQDQSRRTWTMSSMALRIGQALCLHNTEAPFQISPFEQEMRRRVWQCIGILDIAAALDRATDPMMQAAWLQAHPPLNINDEDIWPHMDGPIQEHPPGTFTDTTLMLIMHEAQSVARSVAFADFIEMSIKSVSMRQQILFDYQRNVSNLLSGANPDVCALHLHAKRTANNINGWLQLGILRPLIRSKAFQPPAVQGDGLLRLAAGNLQRASEELTDPAVAQWGWFGLLWAPWHGLAVALAELCVCKDPQTISKYWPVVELMYYRTSRVVADSEHGMLWRPLKKLMNRARTHKRELLGNERLPESLGQVTLGQAPTTILRQQPRYTTLAGTYPMETPMDPNMAAGQPVNPPFTVDPQTMELDPWSNVWNSMDFSTMGTGSGDLEYDGAWANYNNFMGDISGNGDFMFTPP